MTFSLGGTGGWREPPSMRVQLVLAFLLAAIALLLAPIPDRVAATSVREAGTRDAVEAVTGARAAESAVAPTAFSEVRTVAEYVARRYRVSTIAVEPLVSAAWAAGERAGVAPLLIVAVMAIESGFNPIAESPMGAQGLMQVIPRFHQDKLNAVAVRSSLLDPVVNIEVGTRVLKESIRRAGSIEGALQQYAGASGDEEGSYAAKVLAEKQRLEAALRRGRPAGT